jgi:hypothetical protein
MGCFFPPIFKKNTYKKVRFFLISAFILIVALSFSSCKAIKTAVSLPLKGISWVGEKIAGNEAAEAPEKPLEEVSGGSIDGSDAALIGNENVINFDPLVFWAIILVGIALVVRLLIKRHVTQHTKK